MTNTKTIILDLDGVLVNFHRAAFIEFGCSPNLVDYDMNAGWDIVAALNLQRLHNGMEKVTANQFWRSFDKVFWSDLPWYSHARNFLAELEDMVGQENITLCTSAAFDSDCAGGKVAWINRELRDYRRQYFIGCQKFRLAKRGVILIDDADHNIKAFRAAGGEAVMVPRPWNGYKNQRGYEPYEYVLSRVEDMLKCNF
jgi:beta-phosphoglucomutase-like phosphatase (HAD superfamily)